MPGQSKSASTAGIKESTLVIDNGGFTIKAGLVSAAPELQECHVIPNCIARDSDRKVWIGSQLDQCKDFGHMAFRRPIDRGYLVNWEGERAIWDHSFFSENSALKVGTVRPRMSHYALVLIPHSVIPTRPI
jgi:actin-related protein 6